MESGDMEMVTSTLNLSMMNSTTTMVPEMEATEESSIKAILAVSQYVMTAVGAVANLATIFILQEAKETFAPGYLLLLKNQAFLDFMVCTMGTIMVFAKPMFMTGNLTFDYILCQMWHGQFLYWCWVLSSIWNLIMVGYERYIGICHPFKHVDLTKGKILRLIFNAYAIGFISNALCFVQVKMEDGQCVSKYLIPGAAGEWVFFVYGQYIFLIYWLLPFILFCILYGKVLHTLFSRRDNSSFGESNVINSATSQMTKTSIAVTIIFIISMSWDVWYYMLGRLGLVSYIKGTLLQIIGLWLASFNSVANPFVYFVLLPVFRRATMKTLLPCVKQPEGTKKSNTDAANKK